MARVGTLAVALGIGASILCGWSSGPAWADDSADSSSSAESGSSAAPDPAPDTATEATDANDAVDVGTPEADPEEPDRQDATESVQDHDETSAATESDDESPRSTVKPKRSDRATPKAAKKPLSASSAESADASDEVTARETATTEATPAAAEQRADAVAEGPAERGAEVSLRTATMEPATDTPSTTPVPRPHQPQVMGVVTHLVSGVVNAILRPFAASTTSGPPVEAPSMWALLAFARREFESAVRSLTGVPAGTQTMGETSAGTTAEPGPRTLILTAFPAEADAVLARTTLDPNPTVVVDGRHFYLGTMGGKKVIVAMTGIGMVNATHTTETALAHFTPESGISIGAVIFAGVAGGSGRTEIGSVAVPSRWTSDDGATWHAVDAEMLAVANGLTVHLDRTARLGDPLCLCNPLARLPLIDLGREPQLFVGGDGSSDDNNNGVAFPAIPFGGSVFGPQPCSAPNRSLLFTGNFFQAVVPFIAQGLLSNLTGILTDVPPAVDAVDMETAAAQQVADAHGIPFLGIRGMSDGPGDPLRLPGYPFTFFVYNQIAADNAANVTEAFLRDWDGA